MKDTKEKKLKVVLTRGLPASGKSRWAEKFVNDSNGEFLNVNRDDIRLMLQGEQGYKKFSNWREAMVTEVQISSAKLILSAGKSVIVSDTNLNKKNYSRWGALAAEFNADFEFNDEFLKVPYGLCIERDNARAARGERSTGAKVIMRMWKQRRKIWQDAGLLYEPDGLKPYAYMFDIDGTLAHMNGRSPFDWSKVGEDAISPNVADVAINLQENGNHIVLLSGRDGSCREQTEEWLNNYGILYDELHMREAGSNRPDYEVKRELFFEHVAPNYNVLGVFDDRDQVVHLWRSIGLTTFQVEYGGF